MNMRAKVYCSAVTRNVGPDGNVVSETVHFRPVAAKSYPEDGSDEDNTYAKFSPSGEFRLEITNPALLGQYVPHGPQRWYVDFTPAAA